MIYMKRIYIYIYIYRCVCVSMCVCLCVCVYIYIYVCVCVCVCVRNMLKVGLIKHLTQIYMYDISFGRYFIFMNFLYM